MYTLHLCIVTGRKHSKSATSVEHLLRKSFSLCTTAFSHMFFSSTYLIFYVYIGKKLGSLQRNQIFTSSLQDFSNSALWKNTPPKLNMRALHQYAHTSCAHIGNLCLLGKIFNLSKSFHPSSGSVLIPKRVSNNPVEETAPSERQQTPSQIHQKASPARARTDYPWRIATTDPQRAHYH